MHLQLQVLLVASLLLGTCLAFLTPRGRPICLQQHRLERDIMAGSRPIKDLTLLFVRRTSPQGSREILLGLKKRGFGKGKWNGFGGKVEKGESIEQAAMRELLEESRLKTQSVEKKGRLIFTLDTEPEILRVHVFEAGPVVGQPEETDEMKPQWFSEAEIPYDDMWSDDKYWLPMFMDGKSFEGTFHFADETNIIDYELKEVPTIE